MLLEVERIVKRFGGVQALAGVTLGLDRGEILGLIGPNGAGKTTLFAVVAGFVAPDGGHVRLDGRECVGRPPFELCRLGLARTFQIVQPFPGLTVVDNVMVGAFLRHAAPAAARAHAHQVLRRARLDAYADRPAHTLPVGLRKRLELARALATEPRVLLLDEVLAGLNASEVAETAALIREIRGEGVAVLVIEHVMSALMRLSDRVAVLHHGELIATGAPGDVARDARVVDAYLGEALVVDLPRR